VVTQEGKGTKKLHTQTNNTNKKRDPNIVDFGGKELEKKMGLKTRGGGGSNWSIFFTLSPIHAWSKCKKVGGTELKFGWTRDEKHAEPRESWGDNETIVTYSWGSGVGT